MAIKLHRCKNMAETIRAGRLDEKRGAPAPA